MLTKVWVSEFVIKGNRIEKVETQAKVCRCKVHGRTVFNGSLYLECGCPACTDQVIPFAEEWLSEIPE